MNLRTIGLSVLLFTFAVPLSAQAQTPTPGGGKETIQFLYDEIQALKARIAKLESGQVDMATVAGKYSIHALGIELHGGLPARIGSETSRGRLVLNADGSACGNWLDGRVDLVQNTPWSLARTATTGSGCTTWSIVDGSVVIDGGEDDEDAVLTIGAGARLLIGGGTTVGGGNSGGFSSLFMLVRVPND